MQSPGFDRGSTSHGEVITFPTMEKSKQRGQTFIERELQASSSRWWWTFSKLQAHLEKLQAHLEKLQEVSQWFTLDLLNTEKWSLFLTIVITEKLWRVPLFLKNKGEKPAMLLSHNLAHGHQNNKAFPKVVTLFDLSGWSLYCGCGHTSWPDCSSAKWRHGQPWLALSCLSALFAGVTDLWTCWHNCSGKYSLLQ